MGAATVAVLNTKINADPRGLISGFSQAQKSIGQFQGVFGSFQSTMMAAGAGVGGIGFLGWGLKLAGEAQTTEVAFRVMTGSAKSAFELIAQLKQTALDSPLLNYTDTLEAGRRLLAVGFAAGEVNDSIRMLADISAGTKQPIGELAIVLGDVRAKTKLTGEETRQFTSRGIPLIQALADMYGKTSQEVLAMREAGLISFGDVYKALESMTKEGGRFYSLQAEMAGTLPGKMAKLTDSAQMLATAIGNVLVPVATDLVNIVTPLIDLLQRVDPHVISVGLGVAAFAGGTVLVVRAIQMAIPAFHGLVTAYRALATAQAIQKAFSGPAGWATLAVAAGVAGLAVAGVAASFDGIEKSSVKAEVAARSVDKVAVSATKATAAVAELTISASDFSKVWEKIGKTSLDEAIKKTEELFKRGEEITKELRTPQMKFADSIAELEELRRAGAITGQEFFQKFNLVNQELFETLDTMTKIKQSTQGIGAATFDSTAGFSAVYSAQRNAAAENQRAAAMAVEMAKVIPGMGDQSSQDELRKIEKSSEEQVKEMKRQTMELREIAGNTRGDTITVREYTL